MSENCSHNCSSCSSSCGGKPQSLIKPLHPQALVKKVIGVVSGKGGVGKSLVTSMLASLAQKQGLRAAILDADITGPSIPKVFGITERAQGDETGVFPIKTPSGIQLMSLNLLLDNETDPVIWRGALITGTVEQFWGQVVWEDVDILFVDLPPGTGDVTLTVFQSLPLDAIVVVTSPQQLVDMIVSKAINMAGMMKVPVLALVENMSYFKCPDCNKELSVFGPSRVAEMAQRFGIDTFARLPLDPQTAAACDAGKVETLDGTALAGVLEKIRQQPARSGTDGQ